MDWQVRDSVRAKMRILIKRLLKKYKYPPEGQDEAITRVLEQAETLANDWNRDWQVASKGGPSCFYRILIFP